MLTQCSLKSCKLNGKMKTHSLKLTKCQTMALLKNPIKIKMVKIKKAKSLNSTSGDLMVKILITLNSTKDSENHHQRSGFISFTPALH